MSDKKQIYKPKPISGFPEWLPEIRAVELGWLDHIRAVFERYGFTNIETPAVEELDVLLAKGEVDKEIYTLTRLQADEGEKKEARLALHFDQTVPFARYVAQHFNHLDFPFKRYQMQKVWRGERPQLGRQREFLQCDIDVIHVDSLPLHFDAEIPAVVYDVLKDLDIGRFQIRISNRKILLGLLESFSIEDTVTVTRTVDKLEKIGADAVVALLKEETPLNQTQINAILDLIQNEDIPSIQGVNDQMCEGLDELSFVIENLSHLPDHAVKPDLSIVRGLDYYTGTVYETRLLDVPGFNSSICGGGRYDDLAGTFINRKLPGVGISFGITRMFDALNHHGMIKPGAKTPTQILVALPSEEKRRESAQVANTLRARGINAELYHAPQKIKKQMQYAEKKGIPYVWFPPTEDGQGHEVKDMRTGTQQPTTPDTWTKNEKATQ